MVLAESIKPLNILVVSVAVLFLVWMGIDLIYWFYRRWRRPNSAKPTPDLSQPLIRESAQLCERLAHLDQQMFQESLHVKDPKSWEQFNAQRSRIREVYRKAYQRFQRRCRQSSR
jgi:membrane-bound lytic murein transglycosylase